MPTPTISLSGRCSRCHASVGTAGCERCWSRSHSEAASTVITMVEPVVIPNLITAFVPEEDVPIFQRTGGPPPGMEL